MRSDLESVAYTLGRSRIAQPLVSSTAVGLGTPSDRTLREAADLSVVRAFHQYRRQAAVIKASEGRPKGCSL